MVKKHDVNGKSLWYEINKAPLEENNPPWGRNRIVDHFWITAHPQVFYHYIFSASKIKISDRLQRWDVGSMLVPKKKKKSLWKEAVQVFFESLGLLFLEERVWRG